jgi:hypothetical protein
LNYKGQASLKLDVNLTNGSKIPIQVHVGGLQGTLRIRVPSESWPDMLSVAFLRDPGLTFKVDTPLTLQNNETLRGIINKLLSTILRRVFLDLWVFPSFRTFYLPLLEPNPDKILEREREQGATEQEAAKNSTLFDKAERLLNVAGLVSKSETLGDAIPLTFDTSIVLKIHDQVMMNDTSRVLLEALTRIVAEPLLSNVPKGRTISDNTSLDADLKRISSPLLPIKSMNIQAEVASESLYGMWKLVKQKPSIAIYKKRIQAGIEPAEIYKGTISINCDSARIISVLSNPRHFQHVKDSFIESKIYFEGSCINIDDINIVHSCTFNIGKESKSFLVFQTKQLVGNEEASGAFIGMRSVASINAEAVDQDSPPIKDPVPESSSKLRRRLPETSSLQKNEALLEAPVRPNSPPIRSSTPPIRPQTPADLSKLLQKDLSTVYLFGYYIHPLQSDPLNASIVTCVSNMSSDLKFLELDLDFCKKLKAFIEELVLFTDSATKPKTIGETVGDISIDKIKSILGSTANYLLQASKSKFKPESISDIISLSPGDEPTAESTAPAKEGIVIEPPLDSNQIQALILPREYFRLALDFDPQNYQYPALLFEFMSLQDHTPQFGVFYTNDTNIAAETSFSLTWQVLIPFADVQSFSRPAGGIIPLHGLSKGKIILVWDNSSPVTKNRAKKISYKAGLCEAKEYSYSLLVTVPRQSTYTLAILLQNEAAATVQFFSETEISCSIENGKKVVMPATRHKSLNMAFDAKGNIVVSWNNTASVLSSRQVSLNIVIKSV